MPKKNHRRILRNSFAERVMKTSPKYFAVALVLLSVFAGVLLNYTDINFAKRSSTEIFLTSYDTHIFGGQDACFTYALESDVEERYNYTMDWVLRANGKLVMEKEINISRNLSGNDTVCVPNGSLIDGENRIKLAVGSLSISFNTDKSGAAGDKSVVFVSEQGVPEENAVPNPLLMLAAAFLVTLLPGFLFSHKFLKPKDLTESLVLTFAFSILFAVIIPWILNFTGLLSPLSVAVSMIAICAFSIFMRGSFSFPKLQKSDNILLAVVFVLMFLTVAVQTQFPSHDSLWSVYYERQSQAMYDSVGIPNQDALSYLGRPYTFVPGYMLMRASYSWVSGADIQHSFFVFLVLGNLFFISSVMFFARRLKLNIMSSIVLMLFLYSSTFIFGWVIISLLHLFSFALFFVALGLAMDRKMSAGIFAGLAAIFHASFLFGFPFVLLVLQKRSEWRRVAKYFAISLVLFLGLYSYVLLSFGPPSEIQKDNWGYLITGNIADLWTNTAGFMTLALIPAIAVGLKKERKLTLATILLILAFLFLSYRVNIFLTVMAALLFVKIFNSKQLIVLLLLFLSSAQMNIQIYQSVIGAETMRPLEFIDKYAPLDANVLVEPLYGHAAAYFGQRKILSDLYVEYADEQKYLDTLRFIETGDTKLLDKWNISYVLTMKATRIVAVNTYITSQKEIVFSDLDNIYDNGVLKLHYYRRDDS